MFSDGSLLEDKERPKRCVGYGVVGYHKGNEHITRIGPMGSKLEVYDAEMAGLVWAACDALQYAGEHPEVKHVHFFADNTAALRSIFDPKPTAGQVHAKRFRRYVEEFLARDPESTIDINWFPGHEDTKGNERADELAKATAEMWCANTTNHDDHAREARGQGEGTDKMNRRLEENIPDRQVRCRGPYPSFVETQTSLRGHQAGGV